MLLLGLPLCVLDEAYYFGIAVLRLLSSSERLFKEEIRYNAREPVTLGKISAILKRIFNACLLINGGNLF